MTLTPPAPDQFEIAVFGPGVGECIVVHLGDGDWFVVDSCIPAGATESVAVMYFEALGVDVGSKVKVILATHWDDDHISGISSLFEKCQAAEFVCSIATRSDEFLKLLGLAEEASIPGTGLDEMLAVARELKKRQQDRRPVAVAPNFALADKCIYRAGRTVVHTLSPSNGTVAAALRGLAARLPTPGTPIKKISGGRNWTSVAVLVEALGFTALLGADLEVAGTGEGWAAVAESTARPTVRAEVYKVAHHGSKDADDERIWTHLLVDSPTAVLTPYRRGRVPVPRNSDVDRLCGRARGALFSTTSLTNPSLPRRDPAVEKTIKEVALDRRAIKGPTGMVRIRSNDRALVTELFDGAEKLCRR